MTHPNSLSSSSFFSRLATNPKDFFLLCAIVSVATALRFYQLGQESLWIDEIASWNQSNKDSVGSVIEGMRRNVHPPGWTFLLYFVQKFFGDTEFALRLPSAIAGIITVPAIFFLGKKVFNKSSGLIAAAIVAVMWAPIYYSQESRAYALLMMLSVTTTLALIVLLERVEKEEKFVSLAVLYIVMATATAYLHYSGLLLIGIQGGWAVLRCLTRRTKFLVVFTVFALIAAAYLPWLLELFNDLNRDKFWVRNIASPAKVLDFFFYKEQLRLTWLLTGLLVLATLLTIISSSKRLSKLPSSNAALLIFIFVLPYAAFYIKSKLGTPILMPRYILVSACACYLLCAYGLSAIVRNNEKLTILLCITLLVGGSWVMNNKLRYYSTPQKAQFKEVIQTLATSDIVTLEDSYVMSYRASNVFNYYFDRLGLEREVDHRIKIDRSKKGRPVPPQELALLRDKFRNAEQKYVWLLVGNRRTPREVLIMMNEDYEVAHFEDFMNTQVVLYERK